MNDNEISKVKLNLDKLLSTMENVTETYDIENDQCESNRQMTEKMNSLFKEVLDTFTVFEERIENGIDGFDRVNDAEILINEKEFNYLLSKLVQENKELNHDVIEFSKKLDNTLSQL